MARNVDMEKAALDRLAEAADALSRALSAVSLAGADSPAIDYVTEIDMHTTKTLRTYRELEADLR